jgi:hypothetical protein
MFQTNMLSESSGLKCVRSGIGSATYVVSRDSRGDKVKEPEPEVRNGY